MRLTKRNKFVIFGVAAVAVFGLSACSTGSSAADTAPKAAATSEPDSSPTPAMADPAADLVGSGCAAYASMVPSGPGSVSGMSTDPVAVAASNNPLLTTLVAAVSGQLNPAVNLVDTLNGVIAGQLAPDAIVGTHATVEGGDVTVTGSGDDLMVNDSKVICGGVHTANATVYLIDTVLSPPAKQ